MKKDEKLPLEFKGLKSNKILNNSLKKSISVKLYKSDSVQPDNFYKPISKIISFNEFNG